MIEMRGTYKHTNLHVWDIRNVCNGVFSDAKYVNIPHASCVLPCLSRMYAKVFTDRWESHSSNRPIVIINITLLA